MNIQQTGTTALPPEGINQTPIKGFVHTDPGGIELTPTVKSKFAYKDPGGVDLSVTVEAKEKAEQAVKSYLSHSDDPESEKSKIEVSQYLAAKLGTPFNSVYNNYTATVEKIFGVSMHPKKLWNFLKDQFNTEKINTKIASLYSEMDRSPKKNKDVIQNEIDSLEALKPPYDPYKHNIFVDATGVAASMIPYMWDVGKYAIPGAVLGAAAGALTGGVGTVATAATIATKVARFVSIFGRVASFAEGYKMSNGFVYGDLVKLKDKDGNSIDEDVARRISLLAGLPLAATEAIGAEFALTRATPISKVVNKLGRKVFNKLLQKSAAKTITKMSIKGAFSKFAIDLAKHSGETFLYEVAGEEVPQGLIQMEATEMAKNITNDLHDTGFVKATPEEWKSMVYNTIVQATEGVMVMQLPSFIKKEGFNIREARREKISKIKAEESAKKLDEQITEAKTYAETNDENVVKFLDKMAEEEVKLQQHERISTDIAENKATVKRGDGEVLGTVHFTRGDNTVQIDKIEGIDSGAKVSEIVNDIRTKFPDKKVVFSAEGIDNNIYGRLLEDENPEIAKQNTRLDDAKAMITDSESTISNLKKDIEELKKERDTADEKRIKEINVALDQREGEIRDEEETIALAKEQQDRAINDKALLTAKPQKPIKDMTTEEYIKEFPKKRFKDTETGQHISEQIQKLSSMNKEEADTAVGLIERIAKAKGISPEKWISDTFHNEVVSKQTKGEERASTRFYNDLKATIRLAKSSDFKSWVHEIGHVLRTQLKGEELDTATKWAEKESGTKAKDGVWSRRMEEVFADGFVKYLKEGHLDPEVDSIFKKIASFLKDIFENVLGIGNLSEDIKQVYKNQLVPLAEEEAALELFEPKYKEAVEKAVKEGRYVNDEILDQFKGEEWADKEIEIRHEERQMLSDFDGLTEMAINAKNLKSFMEEAPLYMGKNVEALNSKNAQWFENFYKLANREEVIDDINTGNKKWVERLDENYVKDLVESASKDLYKTQNMGLPASIVMAARRYLSKKTITPERIKVILETLRNNPADYRSLASEVIGDMEEVRQVEMERSYSQDIGVEEDLTTKRLMKERRDLADELSDAELKHLVQTKKLSAKKAEKLMGKGSKEIRDLRDKISKTEKAIKDMEEEHGERLDAMIASRKKEIKAQATVLRDALREQKAQLRLKEKERREKLKAKAYMRKLGAQITKDIPGSVDATFTGVLLRLKGKVDPHFRQRAKVEEKISLRDFYNQNPDIAAIMPKGFINELNAKPLNEWNIDELEALHAKIKAIEKKGKDKLRERKFLKDIKDTKGIMDTTSQLYSKGRPAEEAFTKVERQTLKEKGEAAFLQNMRPNRMVDMLDAGMGTKGEQYDGPIYRLVWDGITEAFNNEVREKHRRETFIKAEAKRLKIGKFDLHKTVKAFGKHWSKDEILDIYAAQRNEHKHNLITNNNKITQAMQDELMSHLKDNEKEFADSIINDYAESFSRYAEAYYLHKNIILNHETSYTPIRVLLEGMTEKEMDMREEMLFRAKQYPGLRRSATNPRVAHNHPIKLGLYDTWVGAMAEEEHYINNAEAHRHITHVLNNKEVVKAANDVGKGQVLKEVKKWIGRYVDPLENKSTRGWDPMVRILKHNAGIAYLFGMATTAAKQIPSAAYFMMFAGPKMWSKYFLTPMGALEFKKTRALMEEHSPELIYARSVDQYQRAVMSKSKNVATDVLRTIEEYGLKPIAWTDAGVITVGWRAVFESYKSKNYSDVEAARKATQAVLLSQPSANIKDTAAIYSDDNMLSVFNMFTNQLNQVFGLISYDFPQAIKYKQVGRIAELMFGLTVGAATIWAISHRRWPKDKKDLTDMMSNYFLSTLPVVGKTMASAIEGFDLSVPAFKPFEGAAAGGSLLLDKLEGKKISKQHLDNEVWKMYEGLSIGLGLPYTIAKRTSKAIKEGHPIENILAGGEINKEKAK